MFPSGIALTFSSKIMKLLTKYTEVVWSKCLRWKILAKASINLSLILITRVLIHQKEATDRINFQILNGCLRSQTKGSNFTDRLIFTLIILIIIVYKAMGYYSMTLVWSTYCKFIFPTYFWIYADGLHNLISLLLSDVWWLWFWQSSQWLYQK